MISRLVILPDYQGIGIGYKFLTAVANLYHNNGFDVRIVTSAKNLIYKLHGSKLWKMDRLGTNSKSKSLKINFNNTIRVNCKTASFLYKGDIVL